MFVSRATNKQGRGKKTKPKPEPRGTICLQNLSRHKYLNTCNGVTRNKFLESDVGHNTHSYTHLSRNREMYTPSGRKPNFELNRMLARSLFSGVPRAGLRAFSPKILLSEYQAHNIDKEVTTSCSWWLNWLVLVARGSNTLFMTYGHSIMALKYWL